MPMAPFQLSPEFREILERALKDYPERVPADLSDLDHARLDTIPRAVHAEDRGPAGFITKDELIQLVQWKLKHGKFRPSLLKLAQENAPETVKNTTAAAFAALSKAKESDNVSLDWAAIEMAMRDVLELRGVGPATASLVLSCWRPRELPFFSDELFRLTHWEDAVKGGGVGWDRKIGYAMKEYKSLVGKVQQVRESLMNSDTQFSAIDLEKAAWTMGHDRAEVKMEPEEEDHEDKPSTKRKKGASSQDVHPPKRAKTKRNIRGASHT